MAPPASRINHTNSFAFDLASPLPLSKRAVAPMKRGDEFFNLYNHDFVRVTAATPLVRVADPAFNARQTIDLAERAAELNGVLVLFPELGLSAWLPNG
jgi:hypothetical protein